MKVPDGVVGIDPGFAGGIAFLGLDGEEIRLIPMPVHKGKGKSEIDVATLVAFFRGLKAEGRPVRLVVVESVHSMPKQGVASTFAFGRNYGEVLGAVKALELPLEMPTPQAWKKVVLAGTDQDKLAAIQYASRRFPGTSLLASARSKKPHDGLADALCLAEWGRRRVVGGS